MPSSIEERLLDLVVSKLATITVANGYQETVLSVTRASDEPGPLELSTAELPALQVRHLQTRKRLHLRGAYECVMDLDVVCMTEQDDELLSDLKADVKKVLQANRRWNDGIENLARRTWTTDPLSHEVEVPEGISTAVIPCAIVFRVDATNPYLVKAI